MPLLPLLFASALATADPQGLTHEAEDLRVHGGIALTGSFAPAGGFWFGDDGALAFRWRELVELRVEGGVGFLLPKPSTPDTCAEPPCFTGIRAELVPTIGPRIGLGGHGDFARALTPFVGWAFVGQGVSPGPRTPKFDVETPGGWTTLAAGVGLTIGAFELRVKVLPPREEVRQSTIAIGAGFLL